MYILQKTNKQKKTNHNFTGLSRFCLSQLFSYHLETQGVIAGNITFKV